MPKETLPPPDLAQIDYDLANMQFREPVVGAYVPDVHDRRPEESILSQTTRISEHAQREEAYLDQANRPWLAVTEAARRDILADPEFRQTAAGFNSAPLGEELAGKAVREFAALDPRIARLAQTAGKTLGRKLALEPVPDSLLVPDITNAPSLVSPGFAKERLANTKLYSPDEVYTAIRDDLAKTTAKGGVTQAERRLAASRYRYARDIKVLGLMAELHDNPIDVPVVENDTVVHNLPSGTTIGMTPEAFLEHPTLLDPATWQNRRQLKDRVYAVIIDGQEYIMKERKTPRHTDTKRYGHIDGLTSAQEFAVAREFADLGTIKQDGSELHWERPLGYVEFPDGYQFCLFESEPDLDTEWPTAVLEAAINEKQDAYAAEFGEIAARAQDILRDRKDLIPRYLLEDQPALQETTTGFSFEEFAQLKAGLTISHAKNTLTSVMQNQGYVNSDEDGFGFRIKPGEKPMLEIMGFDFEYYTYDPGKAAEIAATKQRAIRSGQLTPQHELFISDPNAIKIAAAWAMRERLGVAIPPKVPLEAFSSSSQF